MDLLRSDLERTSGSSPAIVFRARLLQAASLLQSALGTQDLGQVFYEPLRDRHGIIIITIINQIRVSAGGEAWGPLWPAEALFP